MGSIVGGRSARMGFNARRLTGGVGRGRSLGIGGGTTLFRSVLVGETGGETEEEGRLKEGRLAGRSGLGPGSAILGGVEGRGGGIANVLEEREELLCSLSLLEISPSYTASPLAYSPAGIGG